MSITPLVPGLPAVGDGAAPGAAVPGGAAGFLAALAAALAPATGQGSCVEDEAPEQRPMPAADAPLLLAPDASPGPAGSDDVAPAAAPEPEEVPGTRIEVGTEAALLAAGVTLAVLTPPDQQSAAARVPAAATPPAAVVGTADAVVPGNLPMPGTAEPDQPRAVTPPVDAGPGSAGPGTSDSRDAGPTASTTHAATAEAAPPAPPAPSGSSSATPVATTPVGPAGPVGTTPAPAERPVVTGAVVQQVFPEVTRLSRAGNGTHRLSITLQPEQLGEVRVTLVVRDGAVRVNLASEHAHEVLVQAAPELRRLLEQAGATEARILVRDSETSAGPAGADLRDPRTAADSPAARGEAGGRQAGTGEQRRPGGRDETPLDQPRPSTRPTPGVDPTTSTGRLDRFM